MSLVGRYRSYKCENLDACFKAAGVSSLARKVISTLNPTWECCIQQLDDEWWTIKYSSLVKTTEIKFKLGVPFSCESVDDRKSQSVINRVKDNELVRVLTVDGTEETHHSQTVVDGNDLIVTFRVDDITSTTYYKRIQDD